MSEQATSANQIKGSVFGKVFEHVMTGKTEEWVCGFCGYTAFSYEEGTREGDRGYPECKECGAV